MTSKKFVEVAITLHIEAPMPGQNPMQDRYMQIVDQHLKEGKKLEWDDRSRLMDQVRREFGQAPATPPDRRDRYDME